MAEPIEENASPRRLIDCNTATLGEAAEFLPHIGIAIVPLRPEAKIPIGRGWQLADFRSSEITAEMWAADSNMNIGVLPDACRVQFKGEEYKVVVLDLDVKGQGNGVEAFADLAEFATGPVSITPSGGQHWFFLERKDRPLRNISAAGFDLLVAGKQAVVPPSSLGLDSEHKLIQYRWKQSGNLSPIPDEIIDRIEKVAGRSADMAAEPDYGETPPPPDEIGEVPNYQKFGIEPKHTGDNSKDMFLFMCELFKFGLNEQEVLAAAVDVEEYWQSALRRRTNAESAVDWLWKYGVQTAKIDPKSQSVSFSDDTSGFDPRDQPAAWEAKMPKTLIKSSEQFASEMKKPTYINRRLSLQKSQLITLTAHPGHMKTSMMMEVAYMMALGLPLDGVAVRPRRVLYLAGENNEDVRLRFVLTCLDDGKKPSEVSLEWVDGSFPMTAAAAEKVVEEAKKRGVFDLVIVDTSAAYFDGEDENSNKEMHDYYQVLRSFTREVEGSPTVVVLTHPPKNAPRDELKPRGGYAVYGTIDGNMMLWMEKGMATLHHSPKWRGASFAPLHWQIKPLRHPSITDDEGIEMASIRAVTMDAKLAEEIEKRDEVRVLQYLRTNPKPTQTKIAAGVGLSKGGASNALRDLLAAGDIHRNTNSKYSVTQQGCDRLDGNTEE